MVKYIGRNDYVENPAFWETIKLIALAADENKPVRIPNNLVPIFEEINRTNTDANNDCPAWLDDRECCIATLEKVSNIYGFEHWAVGVLPDTKDGSPADEIYWYASATGNDFDDFEWRELVVAAEESSQESIHGSSNTSDWNTRATQRVYEGNAEKIIHHINEEKELCPSEKQRLIQAIMAHQEKENDDNA